MGLGHLASMRSAHHVYPSFGIADLRRLTVLFKFASAGAKRVLSVTPAALAVGRRNRKQASTREARTCGWRAVSTSEGVDSLLGAIAKRMGVRVSPRARPCLRAWSIQMDCSVCRSACGLTRRETNPASAAGWRAASSVAFIGSNGRRVHATRVGIRATACVPATLTQIIVRRTRRTRVVVPKRGTILSK